MQSALQSVPGVAEVKVDFNTKTATVKTEEKVDSAKLIAALKKESFGGSVTK